MQVAHGARCIKQRHLYSLLLSLLLLPMLSIALVNERTPTTDVAKLLLTEVSVLGTDQEYVEIYNPNDFDVDMSDYYLTDANYTPGSQHYWRIAEGNPQQNTVGGGDFYDFHARFPDGYTIGAGERIVVSIAGSTPFFSEFGFYPHIELHGTGPAPRMRPVFGDIDGPNSIVGSSGANPPTLTNSSEIVVLYHWDGESDLVTDIDVFMWGTSSSNFFSKTGVTIGGQTYQNETAVADQQPYLTAATFGNSYHRVDMNETGQPGPPGNGVGGRDELGEPLMSTWTLAPYAPEVALLVTNVQVEQRLGTAIWDVTYDLQTVGGQPVMVHLLLSTDGGETFAFQCLAVTGDVGSDVLPGTSRSIAWDAAADVPGLVSATCVLRVLVDDHEDEPNPPEGFVYLPPGTFTMGSPTNEPGRGDDETQHPVTLTQGFYMSQYEVTEGWWSQVMGGVPTDPQLPKNAVSWDMAVEFCNALSTLEGLDPAYTIHGSSGDVTWNQDANGYRLPTEAEWEYACRAGSTTAFANGPLNGSIYCGSEPNLDAMGWYCGNNSPGGTKPVGLKQPNGLGLHDMHGNVYEWVWDGYRHDYEILPPVDPVHDVDPGIQRVLRGGHYSVFALYCRSANRIGGYPHTGNAYFGFRPVRSAP